MLSGTTPNLISPDTLRHPSSDGAIKGAFQGFLCRPGEALKAKVARTTSVASCSCRNAKFGEGWGMAMNVLLKD